MWKALHTNYIPISQRLTLDIVFFDKREGNNNDSSSRWKKHTVSQLIPNFILFWEQYVWVHDKLSFKISSMPHLAFNYISLFCLLSLIKVIFIIFQPDFTQSELSAVNNCCSTFRKKTAGEKCCISACICILE